MMLYRGQRYGLPIGVWWTRHHYEAEGYAHRFRSHVVLRIDVNGRAVRKFLDAATDSYIIPARSFPELSLGVRVVKGHVDARDIVPTTQTGELK